MSSIPTERLNRARTSFTAGGDVVDTIAAMVGGIVACCTGAEGISPEWLKNHEPLPAWALTT